MGDKPTICLRNVATNSVHCFTENEMIIGRGWLDVSKANGQLDIIKFQVYLFGA